MAQPVKVDKAAIHDDSPLVLGHRKDIELDLGRLTILQNISLDIVEFILRECITGPYPSSCSYFCNAWLHTPS